MGKKITCYLCKSEEHKKREGKVRDSNDLYVLECAKCGLVFLDSDSHIKENHYDGSKMHAGEVHYQQWLNDCSIDDYRRYKMFLPLLINKSVLDFGCGAGGFLSNINNRTKYSAGVELDEVVHSQNDLPFDFFKHIDDVPGKFDIITCFHVIEHLHDPIEHLAKIYAKLENGGVSVVEVPSSNDILLSLYDNKGFKNFTYWSNHLFLFNRNTLETVGKRAGFSKIIIESFQRYPLSNHLYWLANNSPGGHIQWPFISSELLDSAYADVLKSLDMADTLIAYFYK